MSRKWRRPRGGERRGSVIGAMVPARGVAGPACYKASSTFSRLSRIDRLDPMVREAGRRRALQVALLAPAGQRDQHRPRQRRIAALPSRQFVAVHFRHADVEDDHSGAEARRVLQRLVAAVEDRHLGAEQAQQGAEAVGRIAVVIDHDEAAPEQRGRRRLHAAAGPGRLPDAGDRQRDGELAAAAQALAAGGQRAAMHFD